MKKELPEFDAVASLAAAIGKARAFAAKGERKAKAGGGIGAAAPALAKDVSDAFGDGGEAGERRAYLAVCCSAKALADVGGASFDTVECDQGRALAPHEKSALFQELRLLVDDRLDAVVEAALAIGDFHLGQASHQSLLREISGAEPISSSPALFGPSAMRQAKPRAKARKVVK